MTVDNFAGYGFGAILWAVAFGIVALIVGCFIDWVKSK